MKLLQTIVVPVLILGVSSSLLFAEEGLLSRILPHEKAAEQATEQKTDAQTVTPTAVTPAAAPATATPAAETPAAVTPATEEKTADSALDKAANKKGFEGKKGRNCHPECKGLKRSTDPMVEEVEEQVWICQTCPCVIIVKKAGIASLHHCGKPMCLKAGKGCKEEPKNGADVSGKAASAKDQMDNDNDADNDADDKIADEKDEK